ncbi:MAG: diaminopimelate dehydrogenase [Oscillospiraceae bacterium]|nr:diaminopimelate dehydrogenase [Oscillospiraceae bacterium]
MDKIKVAVIGYGNVGKYAVEAVSAAPDMELAGVVRRNAESALDGGVKVTCDVTELGEVDVALLCIPTRAVLETAKKYLALGINTVDCYDVHASIVKVRGELDEAAKKAGRVSIVASGWDPGSDSIVRALMEAIVPNGITYTNFGPGMSMGHSVAAKAVRGVKDALSVTMPQGAGVHKRMVYIELEDGASLGEASREIKADPYFISDETHVFAVEDLSRLMDMGHGVNMTRKGVSGKTHNQMLEFNMRINNPALTSQVMAACARAAMRQPAGAYTMIELPVIDMLFGGREELINRLV